MTIRIPRRPVFVLIAAMLLFPGLSGCATGPRTGVSLQEKTLLLEKEIQQIKRQMTAEQEKTNVALNVVRTFQEQLSGLETRTRELEVLAAPSPQPAPAEQEGPVGMTPAPSATSAPGAEDAVHLYERGIQELQDKRYPDALASFRVVIDRSPAHPLADNAQYWIGEVYYSQRDFRNARREFQKVIDLFPEGNKVPDAHLKIALTLIELREKEKAREELERIITLYPAGAVTGKARAELEKLLHEK